jgi:hypothetical protein
MYGLSSRESLSKRQCRWLATITDNLTKPQQSVGSSNKNSGIISVISDYCDSDSRSEEIHAENLVESTKYNISTQKNKLWDGEDYKILKKLENISDKLENISNKFIDADYKILSDKISSLEDRMNILSKNILSLETYYMTELSLKISNLEHSFDELSENIKISTRISDLEKSIDELLGENKHFIESGINFIPFFIKEDYTAIDNLTKLEDLQFDMVVDILGFYSESPIIYPFGYVTTLPEFMEINLEMSIKDSYGIINGTAYGILKRRNNGIYIIQLTDLYSNGHIVGIDNFVLPITLICKTDLLLK